MTDNNIEPKSKLELSKTRLAEAFGRLESTIQKKNNIHDPHDDLGEMVSLKEKLMLLGQENDKLAGKISNLEANYTNIKALSMEVMTELNSSINAMEFILGDENGNSGNKNQE